MKRWTLLGLLVALGACGEARESEEVALSSAGVTYLGTIKPLLDDKCVSCHGPTKTEGSYDLSSWSGLLGPGSDTKRNVAPGDANSRLLTILSEESHSAILDAAQRKLLLGWVVEDRLAYFTADGVGYHPRGWLYPGDRRAASFHGGFLRARKWDLRDCQLCHGKDFKGGESKVSCISCHQDGPTGCSTCHGDGRSGSPHPPVSLSGGFDPRTDRGVGVHAAHLAGTRFAKVPCTECHKTPQRWDQPGHLFDDQQARTSDFRAEVVFGPQANANGFAASYDATRGSCRVYCHAIDNADQRVVWTEPGSVGCGSCHAVPHAEPKKYGGADCTHCHQKSVEKCVPGSAGCLPTADGLGVKFKVTEAHGDGRNGLGKPGAEGKCWACHGSEATGGAPGPDLDGNTDITNVTVGLHAIHLQASPAFAAVKCVDCHKVPTSLLEDGHIDSARPAEVVFSDLASGKTAGLDLKPTWDRTTGTCANVYCHSQVGGVVTTWSWTQRINTTGKQLACDSCHGMPPAQTLDGQSHPTSEACSTCHSGAFIPGGLIDPTKHINGQVFK